jgi:hypothetical protein
MVALKLFELFSIVFFVIFIIILFYAVIRRCCKGGSGPGGKKRKSTGVGVGSSNSDQTNSQASTEASRNTQTIYLSTSNQVGNSSGRTIYTIPINSLDLRRTSVVIVRNLNSVSPGNNNNIVTLRIPETIVEEPPPSYEDCVRLPIDSPTPDNANAGLDIVWKKTLLHRSSSHVFSYTFPLFLSHTFPKWIPSDNLIGTSLNSSSFFNILLLLYSQNIW